MDLLMNLLFVSDQTLRSWNLRNNCGINFFLEVFDFLLHVLDRVDLLRQTIAEIETNLEVLILSISFLEFFLLILIAFFH
jgi:hypothetical protein